MQFAHTGDDGLAGVFVGFDFEGWVFLGQLGKGIAQFIRIGLGFGLNRQTNNRVRKLHGLQDDRGIFGTECIAGFDVLEAHRSADIASFDELNRFTIVGVHLEKTGNTFLLHNNTLIRLVADLHYIRTRVQTTAVHSEKDQTTYKRVGGYFEGKGTERSIYRRLPGFLRIGFGIGSGNGLLINRSRQEGTNCIQYCLNPFVFEG